MLQGRAKWRSVGRKGWWGLGNKGSKEIQWEKVEETPLWPFSSNSWRAFLKITRLQLSKGNGALWVGQCFD